MIDLVMRTLIEKGLDYDSSFKGGMEDRHDLQTARNCEKSVSVLSRNLMFSINSTGTWLQYRIPVDAIDAVLCV